MVCGHSSTGLIMIQSDKVRYAELDVRQIASLKMHAGSLFEPYSFYIHLMYLYASKLHLTSSSEIMEIASKEIKKGAPANDRFTVQDNIARNLHG